MFIKVTTSGGRRYAQLVESFRNESGQPRQRTLATLGRLDAGGDVDRLIQALERLVDLNEQTARITALYQANLQQDQQAATRRSADARRTRDEDRDRSAPYGREV